MKTHHSSYLVHQEKLLLAAIEKNGHASSLAFDLGCIQFKLKKFNEARITFDSVIKSDQNRIDAYLYLSDVLVELGDFKNAVELVKSGIASNKDEYLLHYKLGRLLLKQKIDTDFALECFRNAISLNPGFLKAKIAMGHAYLIQKQYAKGLKICEEILNANPGYAGAMATKIWLLSECKSDSYLKKMMNFELLLKTFQLELDSTQWQDHDQFKSDTLNDLSNEIWYFEPGGKTTKNGTQTSIIQSSKYRTLSFLRDRIIELSGKYLHDTNVVKHSSYFEKSKEEMKINMWAVQLNQGGRQAPHFHAGGFLSGVFYLQMPVNTDKNNEAGSLAFQANNEKRTKRPLYTILPSEGQFVLFPSYFCHYTIPFQSDEDRISIAFDVVVP